MTRRTKIVGTLGPVSCTLPQVAALLEAGLDVVRINASHSDHARQEELIGVVREAARQTGKTVGILYDLQGPKIRVGRFDGSLPVQRGDIISLVTRRPAAAGELPSDYAELDRDLVLYETKVIMEYLDERFPHPPLLPVYPVTRAQSRLWMYRIERDWCPLIENIIHSRNKDVVDKSRKDLHDSVMTIAPIFQEMPFFMSDEFTIVECCLGPILWRLQDPGRRGREDHLGPAGH
jgi:hypothetical protein